jgi:carbon starvation protein
MSAIVLLVLGLAAMAAGYFLYSKFIAEKIYRLDPDFKTPAHEFEDGVDFVPTNRFVLWGHHFTSVAGAAPIVGPAIAVIWGWLPAFLWVVFGTIFFAGVHDFGAIWASVRNKAKSVGALTGDVVGKRARSIFMIVIFLVLLMVNAVFAVVIAGLMMNFSSAVVPVWGAILVALVIGQLIYRRMLSLPMVSIIGVVCLYALIGIGPSVPIADARRGGRPVRQRGVDPDPVRLRRHRLAAAGVGAAAAARLHQRPAAVHRPDRALRRHRADEPEPWWRRPSTTTCPPARRRCCRCCS